MIISRKIGHKGGGTPKKSAMSKTTALSLILIFGLVLILGKNFQLHASSIGPYHSTDSEDGEDNEPPSSSRPLSVANGAEYSIVDEPITNNNVGNNQHHQLTQRQPHQQSSIVVRFLPPLVHEIVLENATANTPFNSIAKIRANITTTAYSFRLDSSNQIRSQILPTTTNNQYQQQYQLDFKLLNHQNTFAISKHGGDISLIQTLSNYTYILDIKVDVFSPKVTNSTISNNYHTQSEMVHLFSTKVPVYIEVLDINNNDPESTKNVLSCAAFDDIDVNTPICTASFKDRDRGLNSELTYSFYFEDNSSQSIKNLRIDEKTGSIFRESADIPLNGSLDGAVVVATDQGSPSRETSVKFKIEILHVSSMMRRKALTNEKPRFNDLVKTQITLTGNEEIGDSVANLTPIDSDNEPTTTHIVTGDPNSMFTIDDGVLVVAKNIDFSERKLYNLTLLLSDGIEKVYTNMTILVPKIVKKIPNRFNSTSIYMSNDKTANENSILKDLSRYAYDTSYAVYKLYSADSYDAFKAFKVDEHGILSLAKTIDYRLNGRHELMFCIEDNRLSPDHYRSFVNMAINVNLIVPPPATTTSTTTTTTTTTSTTTTTTTTTTTPRPVTTTLRMTTSTPTSTTTSLRPMTTPTTTTTTTTTSTSTRPTPITSPSTTSEAPPTIATTIKSPYYDEPTVIPPDNGMNTISMTTRYPSWPTATVHDNSISVKTLSRIMIGILACLFVLTCSCLICRCCCRSSRSKRYRDKNGTLLHRSSFHSQQSRHHHHGHHAQSPNINGSMSRNINSRLSLRTSGHASSGARGIHSKYGAGDSVSLSAMNERAKQKPLMLPPSPIGTTNSIATNEGDENLYANAYGPGHPQYLNELRRLKPDITRMSARLPANKRDRASSSNVNSLIRVSENRNQSKSSSALPSTPIRTSSHSSNPIKNRVANHRPLPNRNRHTDLNGSRMTYNTSANVSPSLNDNNSRTVLLSSDDILTPHHRQNHHSRSSRQRSAHVHTDSTADYDEVVSHSTVQDTTPQTSSESTSMSEVPSESRFKTFVKQKKNKGIANQANRVVKETRRTSGEEVDLEPTSRLLTDHYNTEKLVSPLVRANGGDQKSVHYIGGRDSAYTQPLPDEPIDTTTDEDEEDHPEEEAGDDDQLDDEDEEEDDDDEDEEDEEDDDAEEGVYELSGGNVTGTGNRQRKIDIRMTNNHTANSSSLHQSSSSEDSNGNLISKNKQQSIPRGDSARSQLTTDGDANSNNCESSNQTS